MVERVQLPTGEILSQLRLLEGEADWNAAASLAAQTIPVCITLRWTAAVALPLAEIDKQLRAGGAPGVQDALQHLTPLFVGPNTKSFARDLTMLIARLTEVMTAMLRRELSARRLTTERLVRFNERRAAFDVVAELVMAASPLCRATGIELPAPPAQQSATDRAGMLGTIMALADYEEFVEQHLATLR